jgi:hypothetical protein
MMCVTPADDRYPGMQEAQEDGYHGRLRPLRQDKAPRLKGSKLNSYIINARKYLTNSPKIS